ncbi:hypothetical protein MES5069_680014 [Mesorhizobium escarrei]|uniref:Uncharacterized protein n=1 Tax=Mesorhizobium escarrei TaxID=666018 RepID=A0ABM9EG14_9HYPH|nr:hypothetical protein MES5069_680014 [Mesorhizobium escarrei]
MDIRTSEFWTKADLSASPAVDFNLRANGCICLHLLLALQTIAGVGVPSILLAFNRVSDLSGKLKP